ncbi:MAG: DUF1566 domain-containing protein [Myxococcota bacterium]|nr:DUF1566 domain-containing protein [Myxococcota bacterium]
MKASIRATVATAGLVVFASRAQADAPLAQYALFDLSNLTIRDAGTRLTWQRSPLAQPITFAAAADACAHLNLERLSDGWRVPSYKELLTLVDESPHLEYEAGGLVQKAIDANAFPRTATDVYYWTSSYYVNDRTYAYSVNFRDGLAFKSQVASDLLYVRCVHD